MQLAIVHYHLNRGGVSQVIANHLTALATLPSDGRPDKVVILFSGDRDGWPADVWHGSQWQASPPFEVRLAPLRQLAYDQAVACESLPLADAMHGVLKQHGLSPDDTVLHTHNHSLGKNASLPGALRELATRGYRTLLQVHDFAEDFRPANYRHLMRATGADDPTKLAQTLYPDGPCVHYATLNARDHRILQAAGASSLHLLANPVDSFPELPAPSEAGPRVRRKLGLADDARLIVYPVRGIRRKNVGELLLHAALADGGACFAVTLAPENPAELVSFDRWCALSDELGLSCHLGIGQAGAGRRGVNFLDALAAADALVTTSVAEGFGMVFLEAWLVGKPLVGRNLPEITADFADSGIRFPGLRDQFLVPADWFDQEAARAEVLELHRWACRDYGMAEAVGGSPAERLFADACVDFASLPRRFQEEVIRRVADNPVGCLEQFEALNPGYSGQMAATAEGQRESIAENAAVVDTCYSPAGVARRLAGIYAALLRNAPSGEVRSLPQGESILQFFLRLDRIHPVRLEP